MGSCYLKVWLNIIITFIVVGSAYGETLRIGMVGEPDQLNPLYTFTMRSIYINRMTLRHFNHLGEGSKNVAQIFTKMPTFENGLSKKKLINKQWKVVSNWTIKKDVFWGDGQPVTCDDIKFSVDFAQNKNMTVAWPGYKKIQSVKSLDQKKKSCEIVFKSLEWNYNKQGFTWLIPKHLENPVYLKYNEQGAKAYMANTLYSVNPTHPGLYNGPYVVSEYKIGSHIILTPNKFNKDKKKLINKIIFKFYSSSDSLQLSFKNKEIDMISMLGINVEEAQRLKKYIKDNKLASIIKSNPSPRFKVISINLTHPILKNKEIRQALSYGFDKAKMLKGLSNGVIKPVDHLLTKNDPWFTEDPKYVKKYRFNLVKSKKLIASIK